MKIDKFISIQQIFTEHQLHAKNSARCWRYENKTKHCYQELTVSKLDARLNNVGIINYDSILQINVEIVQYASAVLGADMHAYTYKSEKHSPGRGRENNNQVYFFLVMWISAGPRLFWGSFTFASQFKSTIVTTSCDRCEDNIIYCILHRTSYGPW